MPAKEELRARMKDVNFKIANTEISKDFLRREAEFYSECLRAVEFYEYAQSRPQYRNLLEEFNRAY